MADGESVGPIQSLAGDDPMQEGMGRQWDFRNDRR